MPELVGPVLELEVMNDAVGLALKFLGHPGDQAWRGTLVCDDYSGYKALFAQGVTEAGCLAHARCKFHELGANHKSTLAKQALALFARLCEVEREVADLPLDERLRIRQLKARPAADLLRAWMISHRQKVPPGSATAKAIDYSLGRWHALARAGALRRRRRSARGQ